MQALINGAGFVGTLAVRSTTTSEFICAGVLVVKTEADAGVVEADADVGLDDAKTEAHVGGVDAETGVVDAETDADDVFNVVEDDCFPAKKRTGFSGILLPLLSKAISILLNG